MNIHFSTPIRIDRPQDSFDRAVSRVDSYFQILSPSNQEAVVQSSSNGLGRRVYVISLQEPSSSRLWQKALVILSCFTLIVPLLMLFIKIGLRGSCLFKAEELVQALATTPSDAEEPELGSPTEKEPSLPVNSRAVLTQFPLPLLAKVARHLSPEDLAEWQMAHSHFHLIPNLTNEETFLHRMLKRPDIALEVLEQPLPDNYRISAEVSLLMNKGSCPESSTARISRQICTILKNLSVYGWNLDHYPEIAANPGAIDVLAIHQNPLRLPFVTDNPLNKAVVLAACKRNGGASLRAADKSLRGDADVILAAGASFSHALGYASKRLRSDEMFLLQYLKVSQDPSAFKYIAREADYLKFTKDFRTKAVAICPAAESFFTKIKPHKPASGYKSLSRLVKQAASLSSFKKR